MWFVSDCDNTDGARKRWQFGQTLLEANLNITGHGECFHDRMRGGSAPWANGYIASFKFYLAFENSVHCNDYISEKFWRNSLGTGAVPVVYGPHK